MHDDGSAVEFGLQELLVGVVANAARDRSVAIGNHAVGGDNGIAFDSVRPNHQPRR